MLIKQWIKGAQDNGWVVSRIKGQSITLGCAVTGCRCEVHGRLDSIPPVPAPCSAPHKSGYSQDVYEDYKHFVGELRRRRRELGLDQSDLCNAMGVADGYINKLEAFDRTCAPPTLLLWAQSLGLKIKMTPDVLPAATIRAIENRAAAPYAETQARFKHD